MTSLILYSIISFQRKKKNKQASSRASSILRFKTSGRGDNGQNRLLPRCPNQSIIHSVFLSLSLFKPIYTHSLVHCVVCILYERLPPFFETKKLASNTGIYECVWRGSGLAEFPHVLSTWGHPLDKSYMTWLSVFSLPIDETHTVSCFLFRVLGC